MIASCLWGALTALWAMGYGGQVTERCGNPFLSQSKIKPPRPSECSLRCATLTYYKLLAGGRRGSVLFTEATIVRGSERYYCWFLTQLCPEEEVLEMAFVMLDSRLLFCQLIVDPYGSGQHWLKPDKNVHKLLSPLCGIRFEVTSPFQKQENAAEFCVRTVCSKNETGSSEPGTSKPCPPFLVTLWYGHPGA